VNDILWTVNLDQKYPGDKRAPMKIWMIHMGETERLAMSVT